MTEAERELLLEVAHRLAFHIENQYRHLPNYVEGELTSGLKRLSDAVLSDPPVYHPPTTDKGT